MNLQNNNKLEVARNLSVLRVQIYLLRTNMEYQGGKD